MTALALTQYNGPSDKSPCLIAHGLFGSARNWSAVAKKMSGQRPVYVVDMRNHGQSPQEPTHSYGDLATDLAETIKSLGGPMDVIGHSMGGKASMVLALTEPQLVKRVLIADIAPVAYQHSQLPLIEAMRSVDLSRVTRRSEAAEQLAVAGVEPAIQRFLTQSLDVAAQKWLFNLDTLAADMRLIMGFPDMDTQFDGRALFLTGALSDYVTSEHRAQIKALFPNAVFAKIPRAGHWLHADRPKEFIAAAETFFDSA